MNIGIIGCGAISDQYMIGLNKDKEILKVEAKRYLDIFKDHPYIFNLGHGVLPKTNPQMLDYLIKFVKGYY